MTWRVRSDGTGSIKGLSEVMWDLFYRGDRGVSEKISLEFRFCLDVLWQSENARGGGAGVLSVTFFVV